MRLREIAAKAIKGRAFTIGLDALCVLVGVSKTGKTAVEDATKLALLGHIPGQPKQPNEIHEGHASAANMSVLATFDDGRQIERAWMRNGDGKVTTEKRLSHGLAETPVVMLDSNEYFGKSPEKRLEMIFGLMTLADSELSVRVAETKTRLTAEGSAATLDAMKAMKAVPGENFQHWLERVLVAVGDKRREETQNVQRYQKTGQGLGQLQLSDDAPEVNAEALEAELATTRATLETKRETKAAHDAGESNRAAAAQRRLGLQQNIQKQRPQANLVAQLEQTSINAVAAAAQYDGDVPYNDCLDALSQAQTDVAIADGEIRLLKTSLENLDSEVAETLAHKNCPTCSANKPTWKAKASQVFEKRRATLTDKVVKVESVKAQCAEKLATAQQGVTVAKDRAKAREAAIRARDQARTDLHDAQAAAERLAEYQTALTALEAEHGTPEQEQKKQSDAYAASCEFDDAVEAVKALEGKQQAIANAKADAKRLQDAKDARDKSTVAVMELKNGEATLQDIRSQFMQDGFGPLLVTANIFLEGILPAPLEYRDGKMGYMEGDIFVLQRVFSGAESKATQAAISAALGSQSEARIVVVDELGTMDSATKRQFITNVDKAIRAKVIDQFIGADVSDTDYITLTADLKTQGQQFGLQLVKLAA